MGRRHSTTSKNKKTSHQAKYATNKIKDAETQTPEKIYDNDEYLEDELIYEEKNKEYTDKMCYLDAFFIYSAINLAFNYCTRQPNKSLHDSIIESADILSYDQLNEIVNIEDSRELIQYLSKKDSFDQNQLKYIKSLYGCYNTWSSFWHRHTYNLIPEKETIAYIVSPIIAYDIAEQKKYYLFNNNEANNAPPSQNINTYSLSEKENRDYALALGIVYGVLKFTSLDFSTRNKLNENIMNKTKKIFKLRMKGMKIFKKRDGNEDAYKLRNFKIPAKPHLLTSSTGTSHSTDPNA